MFKELRNRISDTNLLKIKINGAFAAFSFVLTFLCIALTTYGQMHDMVFVVVFCAALAIIGIIGFVAFVVDVCEILNDSLK